MSDESQAPDRRVFRRTKVPQVEIEVDPAEGETDPTLATGEMINVGKGGVLAQVDHDLTEGTLCTVRFFDADDDSLTYEARGSIRRSQTTDEGALVGIEFEAPIEALHIPSADESRGFGASSTKVLVVDDEPSVLELLFRFLTRRGCEVTTATSGEEALAALRVARQDMMLLDLRMPGMGGLEVLERIREEDLDVGQIWAISGYATDEEAREALRLGAADFINKPLDLKYLEWSMQLHYATL